MKKMMMLVMGSMLTVATMGQDRQTDVASRADRVYRVEQAHLQQTRLQQARIMHARLDQPDLNQKRIEQARIKQARIEFARKHDARIKYARIKQQRIKNARIKKAREDAASDENQVNRRRYFKAKKEAKRQRWANQQGGEENLEN